MKVSPAAFKSWPVMGAMLGVVALMALGLAYWSNVKDRERYLQSRNFRLLADMAEQTEALLADAEQVVRRAIRGAMPVSSQAKAVNPASGERTAGVSPAPRATTDAATAEAWSRGVARQLQPKRVPRDSSATTSVAERRVSPVELWRGEAHVPVTNTAPGDIVRHLKRSRPQVVGSAGQLRLEWPTTAQDQPTLAFQLPAPALLAQSFSLARWQRAFSTMAIATPDGRIVFAVGRQAAEVHATSIASLLPAGTGENRPELVRFATTITESRVQLAGVEYRMFTQPCCRLDSIAAVTATTPGLVVIGLAEADALRSLSMAISPVLVMTGAAFVMACFAGWAFLKCWLMGPHERFARHDVVNLLASGVFGVALATILLLTTAAYARLSADVDAHLRQLATDLHRHFGSEVTGAATQLTRFVEMVQQDGCVSKEATPPEPGRQPDDPCQPLAKPWSNEKTTPDEGYPRFITFSMLNEEGVQAMKAAATDATRQVVEVSQRRYYQHARARSGLWHTSACPNGCYLEYVSSWNTGRSQVVIATPTNVDRLPVAALSIPMKPLLAPVLPPGFEFAIIDAEGMVQLHSDTHRNGVEDLLLETDQNPRLRSLVSAHGAGTFNTVYWGHPYRAYVRPAAIPGWSIVVLHGKQTSRALVLEWFVVAILLQGLYTLGCVVVMLVALRRGAPWLWPDPLRRHWYAPLAWLGIASCVVWLGVAFSEPVRTVALVGAATPVFLWAMAYAVLAVRQPGVGAVTQWTELCHSYRFAGTVLLVVTAAMPAASFYAMSYDRHIEAFVKERQIALGQLVNGVAACRSGEEPKPIEGSGTRYDHPSHDGRVTCVDDQAADVQESAVATFVHRVVDDMLPYFTSASVSLRELMRRQSDDRLWLSTRTPDGRQRVKVLAAEPGRRVQVSAALPPALGIRAGVDPPSVVLLSAASLAMLVAVITAGYFVVCFLLRRVLLADVIEPIRKRLPLVTRVGQHAQVVCMDPVWLASRVSDVQVLLLTPIVSGADTRSAADVHQDVAEAAPGQRRMAIPDLEPPPADSTAPVDVAMLRRKLEMVEGLMNVPTETVLLFTRRSARELGAWVRQLCQETGDADRWASLLARLAVVELPVRSTTGPLERWKQHLRHLRQGWRGEFVNGWQDWRVPLRWRARLLEVEGQSDQTVNGYCQELEKRPEFAAGSLTRDQILEEIEENADEYYRGLWQGRKEEERVVLEHVARHRLASAASRRVVRRLLADGLLRKDPELRLMNESFRRFVLESERRQEVATLERLAEPSLWDRLRVPIALSGVIALVFLLITQREALDTTVSMALGVTTAVPTLVKLTNLLAQLGGRSAEPKANT